MEATTAGKSRLTDTPQRSRTRLEVVHPAESEMPRLGNEPPRDQAAVEARVWRAAALGAAIGFAALTFFIIVVGTASGIDPGGALGLGIFAGAFGGTGFGYMVGAIVTFGRDFDSQLIPTNDDHTRGE
jgi:hypothetical protein